jgi:hypothetical protein
MLHNQPVDDFSHFSLVAYVFIYLKGKMQLTPKFKAYLDAKETDQDAHTRIFGCDMIMFSDIVHFVNRPTKGQQLPLERKGAKNKLVWNWTDPIYSTYKTLMNEIVEYNKTICRSPVHRKDKYFFDDLTEVTLAKYSQTQLFHEAEDPRNTSLEMVADSVIPVRDLRLPESNPESGGVGNQSHVNIGFSRT